MPRETSIGLNVLSSLLKKKKKKGIKGLPCFSFSGFAMNCLQRKEKRLSFRCLLHYYAHINLPLTVIGTRKDYTLSALSVSDLGRSYPYCLFQNAVSTVSAAPFITPWNATSVLAACRIREFANVAAFHVTKDPGSFPRESNYLLCSGDTQTAHTQKRLHALFMPGCPESI